MGRGPLFAALGGTTTGPVAERCVGGGSGIICRGFTGGTGSASRVLPASDGCVLVRASYGRRHLRGIDDVPAGREIGLEVTPLTWSPESNDMHHGFVPEARIHDAYPRRVAPAASRWYTGHNVANAAYAGSRHVGTTASADASAAAQIP